jgi:long-chain fatty acid transport protein
MRLALARSTRAIAALAALGLAPAAARAGGFALQSEHGARGMGLGGAFTALAGDPSAIHHNAAGIAFLKGTQLYAGGVLVRPRTTFTGADPAPGAEVIERTTGGALVPPAVFVTHQFSERLVLGAGLTLPFAMRTQWATPDAFSGRFLAQQVEIDAYSVTPTVSYRLADRLAVGAGIDVRLSSFALRRRIPALHPTTNELVDAAALRIDAPKDTAFGFNAGILARPTESLSVGVRYRHGVSHSYRGTAEFALLPTGVPALDEAARAALPAGAVGVTTGLAFPSSVAGGAAYTWGDWMFTGEAELVRWSRLRQISFDYDEHPDLREVLVQGYADALTFRFGVERRLGPSWAARAGYSFDDSPAPASSLSPLLFDADRHRIAAGGSYKQGPWRVDAAAAYATSPARATGQSLGGYDGTYETSGVTVGLSFGYAF